MKKILLIEDDRSLAEMYQEQFKLSGLEMTVARDGAEAKKAISQDVDLILLDILLPDENGFEILKRLKADKKYQHIPVIILTNLGTEKTDKDTNLALALGATDFLVKAYHTPEQVVRKVKDLIG